MPLPAIRMMLTLIVALLAFAAHGQPAEASPGKQAQVYTRGTVQSVFDEGPKHYIRLKMGPGSGLPFRTLTFRVRDLALAAPFPPGTGVEFIAKRIDGENTLTALRPAPRLRRTDTR